MKEREVAQDLEVVACGLAEADAGVDDDLAPGDTGRLGRGDVGRQRVEHVEARILVAGLALHRLGRALHVGEHDPGAVPGDDRAGAGVVAKRADVVHDSGAGVEGGLHHPRPAGIDRDREPVIGQRTNHRNHPAHLLGLARRTGTRPGRFAAHVNKIGAGLGHGAPVRDRVRLYGMIAAIGEAVRGHVEDAHQARPVQRETADGSAGGAETGAQRRDLGRRARRVLLGPAGQHGVLQAHPPARGPVAEEHVDEVEGERGAGDRVAGPQIDPAGDGLRRRALFGLPLSQRFRRHGGRARSPVVDGVRDRAVSCPCAGWRRAPFRAVPA